MVYKYLNLILMTIFTIFLLTGCYSLSPPLYKFRVHMVFKSNNIKYSDIVYIYRYDNSVKLNIYSLSGVKLNYQIYSDKICTYVCKDISDFYSSEFGSIYKNDTLLNILNGRIIYGGENLYKNKSNFIQKIVNKNYNIIYKVTNKSISFKDTKNHVVVKLRILNEVYRRTR